MAITRFKNSTIGNRTPKYNDVLAGLPFRPIIGTATDGGNGTSVSVAFTGNNPAGAGITYTALSSPGSFTATGPASPITVTGLTAGTAYTFQVKAGNSLGDSAYSVASNAVTPVVPTSFESIASNTVTGSAVSTITFSSISSSYQHLQLRCNIVGSADGGYIYIRLNGDGVTSNYTRHALEGNGSAVSASGNADYSSIGLISDSSASYLNVAIADFHDYASTTKNKTVRVIGGNDRNGSGYITLYSGSRMSTNAITSITIGGSGVSLGVGTTVSLYGIKGA